MTHDELRSVVDAHRCRIGGLAYSFTLVGIATEKHRDPSAARHVLDVECVECGESPADAAAARPVRLLIGVSQLGDVRALLTDALHHCLYERDRASERRRRHGQSERVAEKQSPAVSASPR
jgi:hypothetical protein